MAVLMVPSLAATRTSILMQGINHATIGRAKLSVKIDGVICLCTVYAEDFISHHFFENFIVSIAASTLRVMSIVISLELSELVMINDVASFSQNVISV